MLGNEFSQSLTRENINNIHFKRSNGVEYSTFEYEYRVLAVRIFEFEYWWLALSASRLRALQARVRVGLPSTF